MTKKSRLLVLALLIPLALFATLLVHGMQNSAAYYYTISELESLDSMPRTARVKGQLVPDSVDYNPNGPFLAFELTDGVHQLSARGQQTLPDNFLHSEEVILEGHLDSDGVFQIAKLMLQCPSKYEGEE